MVIVVTVVKWDHYRHDYDSLGAKLIMVIGITVEKITTAWQSNRTIVDKFATVGSQMGLR